MVKKILLFALLIFILSASNVCALTQRSCVDNSTLRAVVVREICDAGGCENLTVSEDIVCEFGCTEKAIGSVGGAECKPNPFWVNLAMFLFFVFVVVLMYVLWRSRM